MQDFSKKEIIKIYRKKIFFSKHTLDIIMYVEEFFKILEKL